VRSEESVYKYVSVTAAFRELFNYNLIVPITSYPAACAEYPPELPATQLTPTFHLPLHSSLFPAITTLSLVSKENKREQTFQTVFYLQLRFSFHRYFKCGPRQAHSAKRTGKKDKVGTNHSSLTLPKTGCLYLSRAFLRNVFEINKFH
jgi:hypothetical protein